MLVEQRACVVHSRMSDPSVLPALVLPVTTPSYLLTHAPAHLLSPQPHARHPTT